MYSQVVGDKLRLLSGFISILAIVGCSMNSSLPADAETPTGGLGQVEISTQASSSESPTQSDTLRVLWTITDYILDEGASAHLEETARTLLFRPLHINETQIIFDGQTCDDVTFDRVEVGAREFFESTWGVTGEHLGINDQEITVISTTCALEGFQEYVRLQDRRLIVRIQGIFFFFEPRVQN